VCLRNNRKKGLFNGGLWGGQGRHKTTSKKRLNNKRGARHTGVWRQGEKVLGRGGGFLGGGAGGPRGGGAAPQQVYVTSCAQGSQWDDVVLFDESFAFQDSRARWLYTGITRAAKRLSIVV